MKFTKNVAQNLVELRNQYSLKQEDIGLIAGRSAKTISAWENGTRSPQVKTLKKIAEHFRIDPVALSGELSEIHNDIGLTKEEIEHILALRAMDEKISGEIMDRTKSAAGLFPRKDAPTPHRATS